MDQAFLSDALTKQGVLNLQQGDLNAAIFLFSQAIHHNALAVSAYVNRSTAYYQQDHYELALNDLSRALELMPDHFALYLNRSIIYNKMGESDRAAADFDQAMCINPQNFMTHISQSLLLLPLEQTNAGSFFASATPHLMKVVRNKLHRSLSKMCISVYEFCAEMDLQPNAATSDQVRNDILELLLCLYKPAIKQNPGNVLLYWDRSCLLMDAGKVEEAIDDLDQALALAPSNAVLWLNRGIAHYTISEYIHALKNFSQALTLNPKMTEAYMNRAIVYLALDRLGEARSDVDRALQITPDQELLLQLQANLSQLDMKQS
jgi:tetratricopeptide (TPR) repeat protein